MAYTGTGTQTDPYIVDNWTDFKTLCSKAQVYIAFDPDAENKVIDINDTEDKSGLTDNITLFAHVQGNGWEIRNLVTNGYYFTGYASYFLDIQNLHFRNLISTSKMLFSGAYRFTGCTFTSLLVKEHCMFASSVYYFTNCSLNLHCMNASADSALFGSSRMEFCDIRLTGRMRSCTLTGSGYLRRCRISGEIELNGGTFSVSSTSNSTSDENNVIIMTLTGTGTVSALKAGAACILDAQLIADTITQSVSAENWHALTTAQMQDADYLMNTIGFPCAEVTA